MNLSDNMNNRDNFIKDNKNFIYTIAYKICKRTLHWENDDELSISIIAFNKACDSYKENRGNFFSYAKTLIKNELIDYFRKSSNTPYLVFDNKNEDFQYIDIKNSLNNYELELENKTRAEQIALFSETLEKFNITFESLVNSSPSHSDTKNNLLNIAIACSKENSILNYLYKKKMLPIKEICILTNSKRKFIEKWRKYLITLIIVIANNEYGYLKSYLNIKVGDSIDK